MKKVIATFLATLLLCATLILTTAPAANAGSPRLSVREAGLMNSSWPCYGHDARHTNCTSLPGPASPNVLWKTIDIKGPVITDQQGNLYTYGLHNSKWCTISLTPWGNIRWAYVNEDTTGSPVIDGDGNLYTAANGICSLTSNGSPRWTYNTGSIFWGAPILDLQNNLYIGDRNGTVWSLTSSGGLRWTYATGSEIDGSIALDNQGNLYVATMNGDVWSLTSDRGLRWHRHIGSGFSGSPTLDSLGNLYIAAGDGTIWSLNSSSGEPNWSYSTGSGFDKACPAIDLSNNIYILAENGKVYSLDKDKNLRWTPFQCETGAGNPGAITLTENGAIAYVQSKTAMLYSLNTSSGSKNWQIDLGDQGASTPVIGPNHTLYATYTNNYPNVEGGIKAIGTPVYASTFYFAEGYTGNGFQEYICLGNPNGETAHANIQYLGNNSAPQNQAVDIPPNSRSTVNVNAFVGAGREVSAKITADQKICAERPMYFNYNNWDGGSDAVGATAPSSTWYFAEGYTGPGFEEYITVLNPNAGTANLTFNFQTQEKGLISIGGQSVTGNSRATFKANDLLQGSYQTSLKIDSTQPVVAERPMYFDYLGPSGGNHWTGGHCVMGATALGKQFLFAEGSTLPGFEEYLTLQNPSNQAISVNAEFQVGAGQGNNATASFPIEPNKRLTVFVPGYVGWGKDVSTKLTSASDFLAERPMYFAYGGSWTGGHCVIGAAAPSTDWFFAEGCTSPTFEEYLTLQNPGTTDAQVQITYLTQEQGALPTKSATVPAGKRITINVNTDCGGDYSLSTKIKVTSGPTIVAERPMYFAYGGSWTGGHDVVGYNIAP